MISSDVLNTKKLDGIRQEMEHLNLGEADKAVALTSLILALDKVDSTSVVAIDRLLSNLKYSYSILSYSSGGRATARDLQDSLEKRGTILEVQKISHRKNVMSGIRWTNDWTPKTDEPNQAYLFLLELNRNH